MTLTATQFIVRNITCKNNNVFIIYKKCLNPKDCRPLESSSTVRLGATDASSTLKMEARHGCRSPVWKTTTSTTQHSRLASAQKSARKRHKMPKYTQKQRSDDLMRQLGHIFKQFRSKKRTNENVWRKPIAAFPRLSRHLELLPSSESFAFDWRYFHLHHTQVMWKSHPFYYV